MLHEDEKERRMQEPARSVIREAKLGRPVLVRAAVTLIFAVLAIANPWMPIARLAELFALYAIIDGAMSLYGAIRARHIAKGVWPLAIEGVASVGMGILAIAFPVAATVRVLGGLRALMVGASDVAWTRDDERAEGVELAGIVAVVFGIIIFAWPGHGAEALPWLLGLTALVSGALLFAGGMKQYAEPELAER
jgi:uncharacterized membrane protein HdeD (DUF308 family)